MPSAPAFRVVATAAALAVALVGLLPSEHVHADDHQQVVHRHVIGDGSTQLEGLHHHEAGVDQSDHADARILSVSWVAASPYSLAGLVPVTAQPFAEPRCSRATPILGRTIVPTHDPPLRFTSSPAPPSVV